MSKEILEKIERLTPENKRKFYAVVADLFDSEQYSKMIKGKTNAEVYTEVYKNMFNEKGNLKPSELLNAGSM